MNRYLIALVIFLSLPAMAATYECRFSFEEDVPMALFSTKYYKRIASGVPTPMNSGDIANGVPPAFLNLVHFLYDKRVPICRNPQGNEEGTCAVPQPGGLPKHTHIEITPINESAAMHERYADTDYEVFYKYVAESDISQKQFSLVSGDGKEAEGAVLSEIALLNDRRVILKLSIPEQEGGRTIAPVLTFRRGSSLQPESVKTKEVVNGKPFKLRVSVHRTLSELGIIKAGVVRHELRDEASVECR